MRADTVDMHPGRAALEQGSAEGQHRGCTKQQAAPSGAHRRQLETGGNVEELEARVAEKEKELETLRQSLAAARNQSV